MALMAIPVGAVVAIAQVLWIRGKGSSSADVKKVYLVIEREFEPQLDEAAKEKLYAGWQKAVSRTRDWEPHEDAE